MKPIRKTRHALMFMGAGALAAYFLDPEAGPARRDRVMEQVRSLTGDMGASGGTDQSTGSSGTSSSGSGEVSAPGQAADTFAGSEQRGSSSESSSGPIDLATGKPVTQSPMGA